MALVTILNEDKKLTDSNEIAAYLTGVWHRLRTVDSCTPNRSGCRRGRGPSGILQRNRRVESSRRLRYG